MVALDIEAIRTDGGTQPRDHINRDVVQRYIEDMGAGADFPPVTVFYDGEEYWLADGFHRRAAAIGLGLVEMEAEVHQGTRREAILYSVGANAKHGYPRSNEDKRRAVLTLLNDPEWAQWSDREIARRCGVANSFVSRMRPESGPEHGDTVLGEQYAPPSRTFIHPRTGQPTQMRTENIGRNQPPRPLGPFDGNRLPTPEQRPTGPLRPHMQAAYTIKVTMEDFAGALSVTPSQFLEGLHPSNRPAAIRQAQAIAEWVSALLMENEDAA